MITDFTREDSAPGEHAYPDDQGIFETCTRHALGM